VSSGEQIMNLFKMNHWTYNKSVEQVGLKKKRYQIV